MTPLVFLALTGAGGLGATVRMFTEGALSRLWSSRFPWATTFINLTGSFGLGLLTGLASGHVVDGAWQAVLGTGFLGGYTTFSTASVQSVRLLQARQYGATLANALGVLIAGVVVAGLGVLVGTRL